MPLMATFIGYILMSVLTLLAFECGLAEQGTLADNKPALFWLQIIMELVTLISAPLALRLIKISAVSARIARRKPQGLLTWLFIRLDMLCIPMLLNVLFYEMTLSPAFGYMAIILFICLFFVDPSKKRCRHDYEEAYGDDSKSDREYNNVRK